MDTSLNNKTKCIVSWVASAVLAFLCVTAVNQYYFKSGQLYTHSAINVLLFALFLFVIKKASDRGKREYRRPAMFFAVLLSVGLVLGQAIYQTNDAYYMFSSVGTAFDYLLMFFGFAVLAYFAMNLLLSYVSGYNLKSPGKNELPLFDTGVRSLLFMWALIFILYIPCLLAYYPGIYSYDIMGQTNQAMGVTEFNRFQAIGHTFFVTLCFKIGSLFGGPEAQLTTYAVIQMLIMSFSFAFAVWYMAKIKLHIGLRVFAFLYFALNPINAIFSITPTKDVLFTAFNIYLFILLIEIVRDTDGFFRSWLKQAAFIADLVLMCFFRNNAVYAFIIFFPIMMLVYRKKCALKILRTAVIFLLSFFILNGPVLTALGVKEGNVKEALSVPIQQIACTVAYKSDSLSAYERLTISEILDYDTLAEKYNPRFTDPVKDHFNTEKFLSDKGKYIKLWASLFAQYPQEFLSAFLTLNVDYWYPDAELPDPYSNRMYIETYICNKRDFYIERHSLSEGLYEFYEIFADGSDLQTVPVISVFYSISTPIWIMLFVCVVLFAKKKRKLILIALPGILMWVTLIAGPVSNLRYIYPTIAAYPLLLAIVLQSDILQRDEEEAADFPDAAAELGEAGGAELPDTTKTESGD